MKLRSGSLLLLSATVVAFALVSLTPMSRALPQFFGGLSISVSGTGYQRDVRLFNNAADAQANSNATPEIAYPGALGAALSAWKAAKAWCSDTPSAAKNFDFDWQGTTAAAGGPDENTVSWVPSCGGGMLAFMDGPSGDGWRIRLCDNWTWSDAPAGPPTGAIDIQSVLVQQLGHALGLSQVTSTGRTISAADAAALQLLYGAIPASKPTITHLAGSVVPGQSLVIHGQNFSPFVNVKFSADTSQDLGSIPGALYVVPTLAGGTQATVTVPANAVKGNVLIWEPAVNLLSNGFPIDVGGTPLPFLGAPAQTSGGSSFTWTFTGPSSHAWYLILAINDPTTFSFLGESYLLNAQLYFLGTLDAQGSGSQSIVVPPGLGPFTFFSQIVTFDGATIVHGSNVTSTLSL